MTHSHHGSIKRSINWPSPDRFWPTKRWRRRNTAPRGGGTQSGMSRSGNCWRSWASRFNSTRSHTREGLILTGTGSSPTSPGLRKHSWRWGGRAIRELAGTPSHDRRGDRQPDCRDNHKDGAQDQGGAKRQDVCVRRKDFRCGSSTAEDRVCRLPSRVELRNPSPQL